MILNLRVYAFLFEAIKASIQRSPWVGGLNERFWELNNSPSTHSVIAQIRELENSRRITWQLLLQLFWTDPNHLFSDENAFRDDFISAPNDARKVAN